MATPLFSRALPLGRLVAFELPRADDDVALEAFAGELPPEERAHALTLAPARRATWAGGRLALRAALAELGVGPGELGPRIGSTPRGAPALPAGLAGSVSHKDTVAVALVARAPDGATLGIDVELDRGPRVDIGGRVLTPEERRVVAGLAPAARARETLVAFTAKEATYKALDPWVRRFVSFQEVALARAAGGALSVTLSLAGGEGPFVVELDEVPMDEVSAQALIVIAARVIATAG